MIDTNPEAQRMANDVSTGMIELLPVWDLILGNLKRAKCRYEHLVCFFIMTKTKSQKLYQPSWQNEVLVPYFIVTKTKTHELDQPPRQNEDKIHTVGAKPGGMGRRRRQRQQNF